MVEPLIWKKICAHQTLPGIEGEIKNVWNCHLVFTCVRFYSALISRDSSWEGVVFFLNSQDQVLVLGPWYQVNHVWWVLSSSYGNLCNFCTRPSRLDKMFDRKCISKRYIFNCYTSFEDGTSIDLECTKVIQSPCRNPLFANTVFNLLPKSDCHPTP